MTTQEKVDFVKENCKNCQDRLHIRECSICGYSLGYFFFGDDLYFDAGCYCSRDMSEPRYVEEHDLRKMFEMNPLCIPVLLGEKRNFVKI